MSAIGGKADIGGRGGDVKKVVISLRQRRAGAILLMVVNFLLKWQGNIGPRTCDSADENQQQTLR
jgi:hypothetical protein